MLRTPAHSLLALGLTLALAAPLAAQEWRGTGRAQGVVLDEDGAPLAGARVTLVPETGSADAPPTAVTDERGRWALLGLSGGIWRLTIEAEGFQTSKGSIQVADSGPAAPVRVELRPLAEVSPQFVESRPEGTVHHWLEKGNAFLAQGSYPEARAEYERALALLAGTEKAQVLSSIARAWYLEGDRERAGRTLQEALVAAPGEVEVRRLYVALLDALERGEEARGWLARLDAEGPEVLAAELGLDDEDGAATRSFAPPVNDAPPEPATPHRTGRFKTFFAESSPLSGIETYAERYGVSLAELAAADPAAGRYELAAESYEVYVPDTYHRGEERTPAGLMVWVSPTPFGGFTRGELGEVLSDKRMIWIGANNAGNGRPKWTRMGLALDAAFNMQRLYDIDPDRVYIAGYSGGGRTASALALVWPEVFDGAFTLYGVDFYRRVAVPDRPGAHWPGAFPPPRRSEARRLKAEKRLVLLTGELDFNRAQTRAYHHELVADGFAHVTYLEVPGASHYSGIGGEWMARAIDALDAPLGRAPSAAE